MDKIGNLGMALEVLQVLSSLNMTAVPIEPTQKMIEAGVHVSGASVDTIKDIYANMLLASDDSFPF